MSETKVEKILKRVRRAGTELLTGVFGVIELNELKVLAERASKEITNVYEVDGIYRFTNKLPPRECRICGTVFPSTWSSGGVGAVCCECHSIRRSLDLVNMGVIKDIDLFEEKPDVITYLFKACIDGEWYDCNSPCGDWAYVRRAPKDIFSVPVGYWELQTLYRRHYENKE